MIYGMLMDQMRYAQKVEPKISLYDSLNLFAKREELTGTLSLAVHVHVYQTGEL